MIQDPLHFEKEDILVLWQSQKSGTWQEGLGALICQQIYFFLFAAFFHRYFVSCTKGGEAMDSEADIYFGKHRFLFLTFYVCSLSA
jgi:hypothetical protein